MSDGCAVSLRPSAESGLRPVDLRLRTAPGATVLDLATALGATLGGESPGLLVVPVDETGTPWPAARQLADTPLAGGDLLDVVSVPASWADRPPAPARRRALLRVVAGPDAGRSITVSAASVLIGRGPRCGLRLTDPLVSREHARLTFDKVSGPLLTDEGSAHGTLVDGEVIRRPTLLDFGARLQLGDSVIIVTAPTRGDTGAALPQAQEQSDEVLRPPRFGDPLAAGILDFPTPPEPNEMPEFPWTAMAMPLVLGASLLASSRGIYALAYMVGYPIIGMFGFSLSKRRIKRKNRKQLAAWRKKLDEMVTGLAAAARRQRAVALDDGPALPEVTTRALMHDKQIWVRRPSNDDFLRVRLGIGDVPALLTAQVKDGGDDEQRGYAEKAFATLALLRECPITVDLAQERLLAIAGPVAEVDHVTRAVILRLCLDHSPAELTVCAALTRDRSAAETWLRWLPHCAPRPGGVSPVAVGETEAEALLSALATEGSPGHTVVLVDDSLGLPRRLIEGLAEAAPTVHVLWLGDTAATAPSRTGVILDLRSQILRTPLGPGIPIPTEHPDALLGRRDRGGVQAVSAVDRLPLELAWTLGRTMTSWTDAAALIPSISSLPPVVTLGDVLPEMPDPDDARVIGERWQAASGLRAQIGVGADGPLSIDLRDDGPHALVAGTTGAGKSELLQTLICSLSLNNPPSRVTFLLVDYKGGAAFRECAELPHTVGYITDLTPTLVTRALASLGAEIARREGLLATYAAKDLVTLERQHPEAAPPSLVICVDEFAALSQEVPEFVDGMVNIAQRGRSLGLHLILATQRPAGVVTANIRANTDLRIALRVASNDDSQDVLDSKNAAAISRSTPGRAWFRRTGHGSLEPVQVAYLGGRRPLLAERPPVEVSLLTARPSSGVISTLAGQRLHERTDLARVVDSVNAAFLASGEAPPKRPWLAALPDELDLVEMLADQPAARPGTAIIGRGDLPREQAQPAAIADLSRNGHLLVYGASGSGKTELLRTAAIALSVDAASAPSIYAIDAAGGGLGQLSSWPATGAVIGTGDRGRLMRLIRMLARSVEDRDRLLASFGVPDLASLPATNRPGRVYLLIDDLIALVDDLEGGGPVSRRHTELLGDVIAGGRRVGVHVLATAPRRVGLPGSLTSQFGQRMVLRMNSADDYAILNVPNGALDSDTPPGRGLLEGVMVQIATAGLAGAGGLGDEPRLAPLRDRIAGGARGDVPGMPDRVPAAALPQALVARMALGVDAELVAATVLDLLAGPVLIAGRAGSGRSSILAGIAELSRGSTEPPARITLIGARGDAFPRPDLVDRIITTPAEALEWAKAPLGEEGWELLLVDDAHLWERIFDTTPEVREALTALVARVESTGAGQASARLALVVATDSDEARTRGHVPALVQIARRQRRAFLLSADIGDGTLGGVSVPMHFYEPAIGPGRALLCENGAARLVHAVTATPVAATPVAATPVAPTPESAGEQA